VTGVDLFFIISGFIMCLTIHNRDVNCFSFFINRLIRIWPLYIIATIITAGPALFTIAGVKSVLFYPFMLPDYPVLSQGWTLVYEIYFYILISFIANKYFYGYRTAALSLYYLLTLLILPIVLKLPGSFLSGYVTHNNWINLLINQKNIYFLIGFTIAYINNEQHIGRLSGLVLLIFGVIGAIFINYKYFSCAVPVFNQPDLMVTLSLLFIGTVCFFKGYIFNKFLLFLGNISYSIYLWQYFSMYQAVRIIGRFNMVTFILAIFINLIVSYISYQYIELKLSNKLKKWVFHVYT
jgi:peptidoglycan/LPS O-acetylase OafA/YrhL